MPKNPAFRSGLLPRTLLAALATFTALAPAAAAQEPVRLNLNAILSEDDETAAALDRSLGGFLAEAQAGVFSEKLVDPGDLERFEFFFQGLGRLGLSGEADNDPPTVLKSYTTDGSVYRITIAFGGRRAGLPFLYKIVELKATPHGKGYRFSSPFEERTAGFQSTEIGSVTFHHSRPLDLREAAAFCEFREEFGRLTGTETGPLDYYCFQSLDELLTSYGYVFDANKCNFLHHDLGFMDDGGRRYVTGTGRANYSFEYVGEQLQRQHPRSADLFGTFVTGLSAYYGGYATSGDDLSTLKRQFRERLVEQPDIDFLAEFRKGRKSSIQRHFCHYVISALLCEEAIEQHGFETAMRLTFSGKDGQQFFHILEADMGITEANFHSTVCRLIE